jgi:hypothetical protein
MKNPFKMSHLHCLLCGVCMLGPPINSGILLVASLLGVVINGYVAYRLALKNE